MKLWNFIFLLFSNLQIKILFKFFINWLKKLKCQTCVSFFAISGTVIEFNLFFLKRIFAYLWRIKLWWNFLVFSISNSIKRFWYLFLVSLKLIFNLNSRFLFTYYFGQYHLLANYLLHWYTIFYIPVRSPQFFAIIFLHWEKFLGRTIWIKN